MINSHRNYEWFLKTDLNEYTGKWVAIIDQKVISYGKNVAEVIKKAKLEHPNKRPMVTKVKNKLSILRT